MTANRVLMMKSDEHKPCALSRQNPIASASTERDAQAEGAAAAGCERPAWRGEVFKKGGSFDLGESW